jgi:adenosylcobinamide-GDP ribazoletransferase
VVGLGLGALLGAADWLTTRWFSPLLAALLTVTAWKLLTGGLHLDGLADCLDGLAGRDREQRLAIMRDSRIGSFGAIGLILFLMLELVAVAESGPAVRWRALLVAPVVGRAAPPLLARLFPAARPDGQGAAFARGVGLPGALLAAALATAAAVAVLGAGGLVVALVGLGAAAAAARLVAGRLGGVTGDVLGAGVEVAELAALLAVIAWTGSRG